MNFFFQGEFFSRVAKCFFCVLSSPCGLALFGDAGDKISFDIDRKTAGRQVSDYKKTFFRILGLRLNEKSLFRCNVGLRQMDCKSSSAVRHCEQGPMSLGSSASFRRIVPFRDTSTMESEIPSFRDAQPKQSVLASRHCEERSDVAILSAGKDCFYTSSITPLSQ